MKYGFAVSIERPQSKQQPRVKLGSKLNNQKNHSDQYERPQTSKGPRTRPLPFKEDISKRRVSLGNYDDEINPIPTMLVKKNISDHPFSAK